MNNFLVKKQIELLSAKINKAKKKVYIPSKNKTLVRQGDGFVVQTENKITRLGLIEKPNLGKPICSNYLLGRNCNKNCSFRHTGPRGCREYSKTGNCNRKCKNLHLEQQHTRSFCYLYMFEKCKRLNCPFIHSSVSSNAPICRHYVQHGYCKRGKDCHDRHLYTCPEFEDGNCTGDCSLPHKTRIEQQELEEII